MFPPALTRRNFSGVATFQYSLADGVSPARPNATVTLTVAAPPGAPLALPDAFTCPFNASCVVLAAAGLLANDSSPNLNAALAILLGGGAGLLPSDAGLLDLGADGAFNFTPAE
jgi:hypothetical protein